MGVDHPGLPQTIGDLIRLIKRIAKATLQNASIGRAGLRVYDGGWIRIEDGGLSVTGTADVSGYLNITGTLTGTGTFDWSGPLNITGALDVIGPWMLTGNGDIAGDVDITGILRLLSDLLVKAGGRIVVEGANQIVLEQSGGVARMRMGASEIRGGDGIGMYSDSGPSIISTSAGLRIFPLPTIDNASAGLPVNSLYIDGTGFIRRVV